MMADVLDSVTRHDCFSLRERSRCTQRGFGFVEASLSRVKFKSAAHWRLNTQAGPAHRPQLHQLAWFSGRRRNKEVNSLHFFLLNRSWSQKSRKKKLLNAFFKNSTTAWCGLQNSWDRRRDAAPTTAQPAGKSCFGNLCASELIPEAEGASFIRLVRLVQN